ncbi:MAG TPA: DUF2213 domain-containing protein [Methylophaga aminisulfidivorans]|uniref:DUF2213 domain-containing protein n=2 Tax=root TaxID=1 RepID=A0A7C1VP24_9GAMM|nr:DUF2213 domain-containing protein [Methylophaga aminisulfidivorans]
MTRITIQDKSTFKVTSREFTDEGFLKVPGRVAKTGTQQYTRKELQLDGDPNAVVTVYRPEDEVFKAESLDSYNGADITVRHPGELVNAKNYSQTSKGVVRGSGRRDGDFVLADLVIKDQVAIDDINAGNAELSAGYTADYVEQEGTAPNGENYQYMQRDIKINHVAIVPMGRAGRQARIFDNQRREITMTKVTLDSGRSVDVQDEATALLVTDALDRLNKEITDSKADIERHKATIDAKDEEIKTLQLKSSDEELKTRVERIAKVKSGALKIVGDQFTSDSVDDVEIMRSAMQAVRPATDWKDKSPEYIQASFDMALESAEKSPEHKAKEQYQRLAEDGERGQQLTNDAYEDYRKRMSTQSTQEA